MQSTPGETNGIGVGDGRLHLSFELDTHHIYNPTRIPFTPVQNPLLPEPFQDVYFTARPGFELTYPARIVALDLAGDVSWNQYAGIQQGSASPSLGGGGLSGLNASGDLRLVFNRDGNFTVTLVDQLRRTDQPGNQAITTTLRHTSNDAGIILDAKPGGGALVFTLGYNFFIDIYDRSAGNALGAPELLDNMRHIPRLKVAWKFLPKTALFFDSQLIYTDYPNQSAPGTGLSGFPESYILSANVGANGAITSRLSAIIKAGYNHAFLPTSDAPSPSALAELSWAFSELAEISLGYSRSMQPTGVYGWFSADNVHLRYEHQLFSRLELSFALGFSYLDFGPPVAGLLIPDERDDILGTARFALTFFVTDWLYLALRDRLEIRHTIFANNPGETSVMNDVFLTVALRY